MSIENHPNFHAVLFATNIFQAYLKSLRGGVDESHFPDVSDLIEDFTNEVELTVDTFVEDPKRTLAEKLSTWFVSPIWGKAGLPSLRSTVEPWRIWATEQFVNELNIKEMWIEDHPVGVKMAGFVFVVLAKDGEAAVFTAEGWEECTTDEYGIFEMLD